MPRYCLVPRANCHYCTDGPWARVDFPRSSGGWDVDGTRNSGRGVGGGGKSYFRDLEGSNSDLLGGGGGLEEVETALPTPSPTGNVDTRPFIRSDLSFSQLSFALRETKRADPWYNRAHFHQPGCHYDPARHNSSRWPYIFDVGSTVDRPPGSWCSRSRLRRHCALSAARPGTDLQRMQRILGFPRPSRVGSKRSCWERGWSAGTSSFPHSSWYTRRRDSQCPWRARRSYKQCSFSSELKSTPLLDPKVLDWEAKSDCSGQCVAHLWRSADSRGIAGFGACPPTWTSGRDGPFRPRPLVHERLIIMIPQFKSERHLAIVTHTCAFPMKLQGIRTPSRSHWISLPPPPTLFLVALGHLSEHLRYYVSLQWKSLVNVEQFTYNLTKTSYAHSAETFPHRELFFLFVQLHNQNGYFSKQKLTLLPTVQRCLNWSRLHNVLWGEGREGREEEGKVPKKESNLSQFSDGKPRVP